MSGNFTEVTSNPYSPPTRPPWVCSWRGYGPGGHYGPRGVIAMEGYGPGGYSPGGYGPPTPYMPVITLPSRNFFGGWYKGSTMSH